MLFHTESFFQIAFGDIRTQFISREFAQLPSDKLLEYSPFCVLKKYMQLKNLVFMHQIHTNNGLVLENKDQLIQTKVFDNDGDYIITNLSRVGIAIATADCLPIILYSPTTNIVGIVHAGWRGSVEQIAVMALQEMQYKFNVQPSMLRVFFGPSAKQCCYYVGSEVDTKLNSFSFKDKVLNFKDEKLFFDLPLFNQLQLQEAGIPSSAFNISYNFCTLCSTSFCSYRRLKNSQRQMTVVALK